MTDKQSAIEKLDRTLGRVKAAIKSGELVLPVYESAIHCTTNLTETWTPVVKFSGEIHLNDLHGMDERAVELNTLVYLVRKYSAIKGAVAVS